MCGVLSTKRAGILDKTRCWQIIQLRGHTNRQGAVITKPLATLIDIKGQRGQVTQAKMTGHDYKYRQKAEVKTSCRATEWEH